MAPRIAHNNLENQYDIGVARTTLVNHLLEAGIVENAEQIWSDPQLVANLQNHWHRRGGNGCVFAQAVAHKAEEQGWHSYVVSRNSLSESCGTEVEEMIQQAILSPATRTLSLLFPQIVLVPQLLALIEFLNSSVSSVFLSSAEQFESATTIAFRTALTEKRVLAWIMGFGPFNFFPTTRQAPVTEIVIPVKPKPEQVFHRHNQDPSSAHVADIPTGLKDKVMERLWVATFRRTRSVLGDEPDQFSAARTTFTVPNALWERINV